nr:endochitinase A-like [Penaeus vannamei]
MAFKVFALAALVVVAIARPDSPPTYGYSAPTPSYAHPPSTTSTTPSTTQHLATTSDTRKPVMATTHRDPTTSFFPTVVCRRSPTPSTATPVTWLM